MHTPEYTTYTFLPSRPVSNGPTHAVVLSSSPSENHCSYVAMNRGKHVELAREPDDPRSECAAIFHLYAGMVSPRGARKGDGTMLYTQHSAWHKTLHVGGVDYEWRAASHGVPGSITWYELYSSEGVMFAHMRVDEGSIKLNLPPHVERYSALCDGIVTAIIYMSLMKDPWLKDADIEF